MQENLIKLLIGLKSESQEHAVTITNMVNSANAKTNLGLLNYYVMVDFKYRKEKNSITIVGNPSVPDLIKEIGVIEISGMPKAYKLYRDICNLIGVCPDESTSNADFDYVIEISSDDMYVEAIPKLEALFSEVEKQEGVCLKLVTQFDPVEPDHVQMRYVQGENLVKVGSGTIGTFSKVLNTVGMILSECRHQYKSRTMKVDENTTQEPRVEYRLYVNSGDLVYFKNRLLHIISAYESETDTEITLTNSGHILKGSAELSKYVNGEKISNPTFDSKMVKMVQYVVNLFSEANRKTKSELKEVPVEESITGPGESNIVVDLTRSIYGEIAYLGLTEQNAIMINLQKLVLSDRQSKIDKLHKEIAELQKSTDALKDSIKRLN